MAAKWGKKGKQADKRPVEVGTSPERISNRLDRLLIAEDKSTKINPFFKISKKWIIAMSLLLFISIFLSIVLIQRYTKSPNTSDKQKRALTKIIGENSAKDVVKNFGEDYHNFDQDLQKSSYKEWDKDKVEKIYFNLIYADKVGAYTQVFSLLSQLELAKRAGVDINDNSYGVNQDKRDEFLKKANERAKKATDSHQGGEGV